jgi:hypothetical protein
LATDESCTVSTTCKGEWNKKRLVMGNFEKPIGLTKLHGKEAALYLHPLHPIVTDQAWIWTERTS